MAEPKTAPQTTAQVITIAEITIKAIKCSPKDAVKQDKSVFMARIFGELHMIKVKERRDGTFYNNMIGQFRADKNDGTSYQASKMILPGSIGEMLEAAYKAGGEKPIQFGYNIFSTPDDVSSTGFRYAGESLIKTETTDHVAALAMEFATKELPK